MNFRTISDPFTGKDHELIPGIANTLHRETLQECFQLLYLYIMILESFTYYCN